LDLPNNIEARHVLNRELIKQVNLLTILVENRAVIIKNQGARIRARSTAKLAHTYSPLADVVQHWTHRWVVPTAHSPICFVFVVFRSADSVGKDILFCNFGF